MKLCITAHSKNIHTNVDQLFESCKYYIIYDTDSMKYEYIRNKDNNFYSCDQIINFLNNKGIKIILTGHVGPNIFQDILASGLDVQINIEGKVNEVIYRYKGRRMK